MILTVEMECRKPDITSSDISEVAICFDRDGLELLLQKLQSLRDKIGHLHLMTPSWAGQDLSADRQGGPDYRLVNHLRLVKIR